MIRRHKVWAVASFEFLSDVKRISFIIGVLGMPVFLLAYGGLIAFVGILAERSKPASITYGIVDQANVLTLNSISINTPQLLPEEMRSTIRSIDSTAARFTESVAGTKIVFRPLHHRDSALAALKEKSINGFFLLRSDYLDSGIVDSYIGESEGLNIRDPERAIRTLLVENLLKGSVPEKLAQRIREPWTMGKSWIVKSTGELTERSVGSTLAKVGVPFVFSIVLVLSIVGSGMSLIQGTAVEKENRVVDVLLSSATADEILAGKLLGLGGSGLLQVGAWFGMAGLAGILFTSRLASVGIELAWGPLALGVLYFLCAYFFIGSLMIGTGALGSNFKEGQLWSIVWIMMTVLPIVFIGSYIRAPHNTIAKILTWFPFSSSSVVTFRLWMDPSGIAWWEILGPLFVLIACTWLTVRFAARLFRLGLLLTGTRLTPSEIFRQMRLRE